MRLSNTIIFLFSLGFLLYGCTQDPEIENNDPAEPVVELDVTSRISGELSIVSTSQSSDFTYGAEIVRIMNGAESGEKFSFTTKELDENHRYSWLTEGLQPNSTYMARSFLTNGRDIKYSASKTYTTPSTSKPTLSSVTQEGSSLVATIVDNGGRSIEETGFVVGDTPNRKELMRKEKIPASKQTGDHFSLSMSALSGGKTYYAIAYALDEQEDVGYSAIPFEVYVPQYAKSITLSMAEAMLPIGGSITITATVSPEDAVDKTVTWESSNPEIALVQDGLVTGLKEGKVTITATVSEISATCEITVMDFSVSFIKTEGEVYVGEIFTIEATILPETLKGITLTWESSNPAIAQVTQDGNVTPVGVGECTITASAFGQSASFKCTVVSEAPVFPDPLFREYVFTNFDTNNDGFLSREEALRIYSISIPGTYDKPGNYSSLEGIEFFSNLQSLYCAYNQITNLDVSHNFELCDLQCDNNPLPRLIFSNNIHLVVLTCSNTSISSLDVTNCPQLQYLSCFYTQISSLDVSNCSQLTHLYCSETQLSSLDVTNCTKLKNLSCSYTQISSLELSNCSKLKTLYCHNTQLSSLDVTSLAQLEQLSFSKTLVSSIDVSKCPLLRVLLCYNTEVSSLDVSNCPLLEQLNCSKTNVSSIDVTNCTQLKLLQCGWSQLSSLDVSRCPQLERLECNYTQVPVLDITNCTHLEAIECNDTPISYLDVSNCTQLTRIGCANTTISSLDVSKCPLLKSLCFNSTQVSFIDVTNCPLLNDLWCIYTPITSLDLRNNVYLNTLGCYGCPFLTDILLIAGHEYETLLYDQGVATLHF